MFTHACDNMSRDRLVVVAAKSSFSLLTVKTDFVVLMISP